ncbi:MAG: hypothetical protein K0R27_3948 [Xanthobacteraceae bacterium]|jgi:hypothetical protein|nr:hypothetical protein [Xanthobacteraceae bacterium]
MWGRVAGDALDLATLMTGLGPPKPHGGALFFAIGTVVVVVTLIDMCCAAKMQQEDDRPRASV